MSRRVVLGLVAVLVFGVFAGVGFLVVKRDPRSPSASVPATTALTAPNSLLMTTTTPTTQPRAELPDFTSFTFPAGTCEPGTKAVKVVNGRGGNAETDPPEIIEVKVSKSDLKPGALSCQLEGDITSECNGTIVTKAGTTRQIHLAFAPDLPPGAEYVNGEIVRGGKPFSPARSLVIDFTAS